MGEGALAGMTQAQLEAYRKGAKNAVNALHVALHHTSRDLNDYTWSLEELCTVIGGFEPIVDKAVDRAIKERS